MKDSLSHGAQYLPKTCLWDKLANSKGWIKTIYMFLKPQIVDHPPKIYCLVIKFLEPCHPSIWIYTLTYIYVKFPLLSTK